MEQAFPARVSLLLSSPLPSLPLNVQHLPHHYTMSSASNSTSTASNFEAIFNAALTEYSKQTGKDLRDHLFASKIDSCDNPDSIIAVFQEQVRAFDEFRKGDIKLFKWVKPVVKVLHTISASETVSNIASNVSPTTPVIFRLDPLSLRCFLPQRRSSPLSTSFYP